jgi:tRNA threonylcarbamoyladenosine biosynthesis protein TsaE
VSLLPPLAPDGRLALTEPELTDWGRRLGRQITSALVITLAGDLGSGKTTLARAICEGYGVQDDVTSPTFAIVHEYRAPRSPVFHLDLFRLQGAAELHQVGWDDIVESGAVILIEWPERAGNMLPAAHLPLELSHVPGEPDRRVLYAGGRLGHPTGGTSHP